MKNSVFYWPTLVYLLKYSMSLLNITIGEEAPEIINVVIEIPKGSPNKYEFDDKTGVFKLDRVLFPPLVFPADYGFIPQTLASDGDHLDAIVLSEDPLLQGSVIRARPIGLLKMVDSGNEDCKVLAVEVDNPNYKNIKNVNDVASENKEVLEKIAQFFRIYKGPEEKEVEVLGWEGTESAKEEIRVARDLFKK